jgi:hypothetical protein
VHLRYQRIISAPVDRTPRPRLDTCAFGPQELRWVCSAHARCVWS